MAKVFLHDQTRESAVESGHYARLVVICSSGSVVKAVCGQMEYSAVANSSNEAVFDGLHHGVWNISLDVSGQIVSKTVEIITDYEVVIDFFTATIVVEYPEDSVCTCSNGIVTYTAPDTSGLWYCVVSDMGTWSVSCTDGSSTKTKDVEIFYADSYVDVFISYFEAIINVTYPNGALCSCSNGDTLYSASDTTGTWSFTVYSAGEWTITASDGIQTVNTTVDLDHDGQVESATIKFFVSTIDITYPEGAMCTCTDGITSFTAPNTSGRWTLTVPRTGTWTVRAFKGNGDVTQTVDITYDGQTESVLCEFFVAYINVTYPKDTFKAVLRYVNEYGTKDDIAVDTSGSGFYCFAVDLIGSYEVSIYRVSPYVGIESEAKDYSSSIVDITEAKQTVDITLEYITVPEFTYTGTYRLTDDYGNNLTSTDGDWNVQFLTGGNLRFTKLNGANNGIDVFVLGGGGDGGEDNVNTAGGYEYGSGGGGGGGGYRTTSFGVTVATGLPYEIVVGGAGGSSSAFEVSANPGGNGGSAKGGGEGGSGGSKGGKGAYNANDADDGEDGSYAFLGTVGLRYGPGGGGGKGYNGEIDEEGGSGSGGRDGGGYGGAGNATANSGGGGGGEDRYDGYGSGIGRGASGIVIIRNKRYLG